MDRVNTYADEPEEARLARERWERQQKNAPRTGSATTDLILRAFDDRTRGLEGVAQLQDYKTGKIDSTQINEEQRPIGSKAILNGKEVYWSGQNYGYQSKGSYDKLMEEGQFRMGQIAGQRLGNDIVNAISPEAKQAAADAVQGVVKAGQDLYYESPSVRQAVNDFKPVLQFAGGVIRLADQGLEQFSRITNTSRIITDEAVMALATGGATVAARRATPLVKQGIKYIDEVAPVIDDLMPSPGGGPKVAVAGNASIPMQMSTVVDNLDAQMSKPLQIASDLKQGSNWQNTVRSLKEGDNTRQIRDFLLKGPGGKIKKGPTGYLLVTADELAANKGGMLDKMLERADNVAKAWERYNKNKSPKAQRALYDIASKNIFDSAELIYGKDGPRSYLTKVTNWLSNDQWHHVFGNKEAGEFILMQAAQDPLVAVNIFKRMENLGLSSSGVAQNIALMKQKRHTNWHDFVKAEGFEPKSPGKPLTTSGSTAPGDFADLSKALGEEIAAGKGDVNDIFKMLDLYAAYNQYVRSKLPEYGAEIISDLPEGVGKALQIGGYKTKSGRPRKRS